MEAESHDPGMEAAIDSNELCRGRSLSDDSLGPAQSA